MAEIAFKHGLWLSFIPVSLALYALASWRRDGLCGSFAMPWQALVHRVYRHPLLAATASVNATAPLRFSWYRQAVRWLAWPILLILVHIALAQPYRSGEKLPEPPAHRDIVFVVDTSVSLVLRDYLLEGKRVSREKVLKDVLARFIDGLHGNRLGLIAFSEKAYTWVPLTVDHDLLRYQLARLQPARLTGRTSRLGEALLYLARRYADGARGTQAPPVFVLISDANRPGREIDPRVAAAWLADKGIVLHTIALGAGSRAAIEGGPSDLIYQPMNYQLLEEIAAAAHGEFFWARDRDSLQDALALIRQTAKSTAQPLPEYVEIPLYQWVLGTALLWILIWQLVPLLFTRVEMAAS